MSCFLGSWFLGSWVLGFLGHYLVVWTESTPNPGTSMLGLSSVIAGVQSSSARPWSSCQLHPTLQIGETISPHLVNNLTHNLCPFQNKREKKALALTLYSYCLH